MVKSELVEGVARVRHAEIVVVEELLHAVIIDARPLGGYTLGGMLDRLPGGIELLVVGHDRLGHISQGESPSRTSFMPRYGQSLSVRSMTAELDGQIAKSTSLSMSGELLGGHGSVLEPEAAELRGGGAEDILRADGLAVYRSPTGMSWRATLRTASGLPAGPSCGSPGETPVVVS